MQATPEILARWWRPLSAGDRRALALIVGLPTLLFALPALLGHPAIAQDNLIQNFPLRVLTGQQIHSGHLPLLNPLADSGTPLLGGMNAGSFFPLTSLFAALPAIMAWVLNLIAVYVAAALGMFALLRWHGLRTFASLLPALVYAYSGAMIGQLVHLGVIQGYALLPWALLALLAMARAVERAKGVSWARRLRILAPSITGLGALWGLTALTGEPRAIAEMQLVLLIAGPVVVLVRSSFQPSSWSNRFVYLGGVALGVLWGAVIGLAQLLPGWDFINQSQRTGLTYQWYGAGSLAVRWTSLMFIPDIFGGNGILHQPSYFVNYNLPEVTGYVGVLAVVALVSYMTHLTRRGWRGVERDWIVYFVLIVAGLFATWGSFTPLGHIFRDIPLYGSTRLQSRNIIVVDLGLTVLLGWFLQRLADRDYAGAGLVGRRRWLTVSPALFVVALSFASLFFGSAIIDWLAKSTTAGSFAHYERPTLVLHLLVALGFAWCLVWGLKSRRLLRWITLLVVADVLVFAVFCSDGFLAGHVNVEPSRANAVAQLDEVGRFALVGPSGSNQYLFENLGGANMNVFTGLSSVQGYGSLIDQHYGATTDTHPLYGLDGCQLARNIYHQLRLSSVVVSMNKLVTPVTPSMARPQLCVALRRSTTQYRYFGAVLPVDTVTIVGPGNRAPSTGWVYAQLLNSKGKPFGVDLALQSSPAMSFDFAASHEEGAGVVITSPTGTLITSTTLRLRGHPEPSYQLDTAFQQAVSSPAWRLRMTSGTLAYFRATTIRPSAWIASHTSASRVTKIRDVSWGDSWVTVVGAHPTTIKRSMEWIPGWRATAVNNKTGASETLHVVRTGLIQQVAVPAGDWTVHFHYHAPHINIGLLGSSLGIFGLLASVAYLRGWAPRRRKGRVNP
jgi:hypothetical protein